MAKCARLLPAAIALALSLPAPVFAQDEPYVEERTASDITRRLEDPMTQYMVAGAIAAMGKSLLDMPIEPFVRAIRSAGGTDAVRDLPPDARLGDIAGPEADELPGKVMERVPRMMGSMAGISGAFEDLMPEIEAMARRMKDAVPY